MSTHAPRYEKSATISIGSPALEIRIWEGSWLYTTLQQLLTTLRSVQVYSDQAHITIPQFAGAQSARVTITSSVHPIYNSRPGPVCSVELMVSITCPSESRYKRHTLPCHFKLGDIKPHHHAQIRTILTVASCPNKDNTNGVPSGLKLPEAQCDVTLPENNVETMDVTLSTDKVSIKDCFRVPN